MGPQSGLAPSSKHGAAQPLFFVNYLDRKDRKSIGRHAQLATHRKKRAKKIAVVAASKDGLLATGPLTWRKKEGAPAQPLAAVMPNSLVSPKTVLGASRTDPFSCYPIAPSPEIDALVDHRELQMSPT
jgi:hypothetical protein